MFLSVTRAGATILVAFVLVAGALADAFGRFGYQTLPQVPGWIFDGQGFRVDAPGADALRFVEGFPAAQPEAIDERRAIFRTGERVFAPSRLRFDLMDVGPLLECRKGLELRIGSTRAPYLSWAEGSVGPDVPTPPARWFVLSFADDQPPIVVGLTGDAASLKVVGSPGAWRVLTEGKPNLGWVRLGLPAGAKPFSTNSAGDLGRLTTLARANVDRWTAPLAELSAFVVTGDDDGVTAKWTFNRAGVVVPSGMYLAPGGGYGLRFLSDTVRTALPLPSGRDEPATRTVLTREPDLIVRFPVRRITFGRALTLGAVPPIAAPSGYAAPGEVGRFALANLFASRVSDAPAAALDAGFLEAAQSSEEPLTRQRLLFGSKGEGLAEAGANALLARARATAEGLAETPEPQLVSLIWRRDWRSLSFFGVDDAIARRTAVLAGVAGALSPDPARRLEGALFEAGLAAGRGVTILRALEGGAPLPKLLDPWAEFRRSLFAYPVASPSPFLAALRSPLRIVGDQAFIYRDGVLSWEGGGEGTFDLLGRDIVATAQPPLILTLAPPLEGERERLRFSWKLAVPGSAALSLVRPEGAAPVPAAEPVPIWDETPR